jgi:hypothetical protein
MPRREQGLLVGFPAPVRLAERKYTTLRKKAIPFRSRVPGGLKAEYGLLGPHTSKRARAALSSLTSRWS